MIAYSDPRIWAKRVLSEDSWLDGVPIVGTVPERFSGDLVWIALDGGPQMWLRENVFLRVNVFADMPDRALSMARRVEAVLYDHVDGDPVVSFHRATGPNLDVDGDHFQVYSLFDLMCRPYVVD